MRVYTEDELAKNDEETREYLLLRQSHYTPQKVSYKQAHIKAYCASLLKEVLDLLDHVNNPDGYRVRKSPELIYKAIAERFREVQILNRVDMIYPYLDFVIENGLNLEDDSLVELVKTTKPLYEGEVDYYTMERNGADIPNEWIIIRMNHNA